MTSQPNLPNYPEMQVQDYFITVRRLEYWGLFFWSLGLYFWTFVFQWKMILSNFQLSKKQWNPFIPPFKKERVQDSALASVVSKDTSIGAWGKVWGYGQAEFFTAAVDLSTDTENEGEEKLKQTTIIRRAGRVFRFILIGWYSLPKQEYVAALQDLKQRAETMKNQNGRPVFPVQLRLWRNVIANLLQMILTGFPIYLVLAFASGGLEQLKNVAIVVFLIGPAITWVVQPHRVAQNSNKTVIYSN